MYGTILAIAQGIVLEAGQEDFDVRVDKTFLDYAQLVFDIINDWPDERKQHPKLAVFLRRLMELRDDFEREVFLDPMVLYKPRSPTILAFLRSPAKIRYLHTGNRSGKTTASNYDNYCLLTGNHPYRPIPKFPSSVIAIGPDYANYAQMVFEPKYIDGEPDSFLTPVFPFRGRWFHSYNRNNKTLRLGCAECAAKLMSRDCPHAKPALYLCSDKGKPGSIAGGQHGKLHIDEQVQKEFYLEGMQRLQATLASYCDITETPVYGQAWWTYSDIKAKADNPKFGNRYTHPTLNKNVPYIATFTGSQYDGGLVLHSEIEAWCQGKEPEEIDLRVYGKHVSLATHKVFNQDVLRELRKHAVDPKRGLLFVKGEKFENAREILREAEKQNLRFEEDPEGLISVWHGPELDGQYIIGVDVAEGLVRGDNSIAHVYKMTPLDGRLHLEHVAKFRGHINPVPYSYSLLKLSLWYNHALLVIERNGPGHTVIYELTQELDYYELFQGFGKLADVKDQAESQYGITTSGESKSTIVGLGQETWHTGGRSFVTTYDLEFLYEMEHYVQERTEKGYKIRYHGEGNCHDDEVTAYLMANFVVMTEPNIYDFGKVEQKFQGDLYAGMTPHQRKFWQKVHADLRQEQRDREDPW